MIENASQMPIDIDDHELAKWLAIQTGERLVALRAQLSGVGVRGQELKDRGDLAAHDFLAESLRALRPNDAVRSEERRDEETNETKSARLVADRTWIVDPLDGTREFSEPPREDWAVHVALVRNEQPVAGAVSLPAQQRVFSTAEPLVTPRVPEKLRVIVSRTRPPREALRLADLLDAELVEMGSAGAKAMAIVDGIADIYPHSGGQYEWDSCAPVAVCQHAGLHCSRIDGSTLRYNQPEPYLPDLLICHRSLVDQVREILDAAI